MLEWIETLPKPGLDDLEVMIKLLKLQDKTISKLKYQDLAHKISVIFQVNVNEQDIFLLYEPSLQNDIVDSETHFGNILNYSPSINSVN